MLGAHGGMHQKWHNAYEETVHVPFVVSSPLFQGGRRESDIATSHADLLPTLLGLAGIDPGEALQRVAADHTEARPLVGRDLSGLIRGTGRATASDPVLFITDDEISEGSAKPGSPLQRWARKLGDVRGDRPAEPRRDRCRQGRASTARTHLVKFSRYHDNPQFWTVPGVRDERLQRGRSSHGDRAVPDEYELYDLTLDPLEQHNLAHPSNADDRASCRSGCIRS